MIGREGEKGNFLPLEKSLVKMMRITPIIQKPRSLQQRMPFSHLRNLESKRSPVIQDSFVSNALLSSPNTMNHIAVARAYRMREYVTGNRGDWHHYRHFIDSSR